MGTFSVAPKRSHQRGLGYGRKLGAGKKVKWGSRRRAESTGAFWARGRYGHSTDRLWLV